MCTSIMSLFASNNHDPARMDAQVMHHTGVPQEIMLCSKFSLVGPAPSEGRQNNFEVSAGRVVSVEW